MKGKCVNFDQIIESVSVVMSSLSLCLLVVLLSVKCCKIIAHHNIIDDFDGYIKNLKNHFVDRANKPFMRHVFGSSLYVQVRPSLT